MGKWVFMILLGMAAFGAGCSGVDDDNPLDPSLKNPEMVIRRGPFIQNGDSTTDRIASLTITHQVFPIPNLILDSANGRDFISRPYPRIAGDGLAPVPVSTIFSFSPSDLSDDDGARLTYYVKYEDSLGRRTVLTTDTIMGPLNSLTASTTLTGTQFLEGRFAAILTIAVRFTGAATESVNLFINDNIDAVSSASVTQGLVAKAGSPISSGVISGASKSTIHSFYPEFAYEVDLSSGAPPEALYLRIGDVEGRRLSPIETIPLDSLSALSAPTAIQIYISRDSLPGTVFGPKDQVAPVQAGGGGESGTVPDYAGNVASGPFRVLVPFDTTKTPPDQVRLFQDTDSDFGNGPGLSITVSGEFHPSTNPGFIRYPGSTLPIFWHVQTAPFRTRFGVGSQTFLHAQFKSQQLGLSAIVTTLYRDHSR